MVVAPWPGKENSLELSVSGLRSTTAQGEGTKRERERVGELTKVVFAVEDGMEAARHAVERMASMVALGFVVAWRFNEVAVAPRLVMEMEGYGARYLGGLVAIESRKKTTKVEEGFDEWPLVISESESMGTDYRGLLGFGPRGKGERRKGN